MVVLLLLVLVVVVLLLGAVCSDRLLLRPWDKELGGGQR